MADLPGQRMGTTEVNLAATPKKRKERGECMVDGPRAEVPFFQHLCAAVRPSPEPFRKVGRFTKYFFRRRVRKIGLSG
jgi:hypothetical protein